MQGSGKTIKCRGSPGLRPRTSFVGLLGTSAPFQRPAMAISRNWAPGVLLYSRFQLSSAIGDGGSSDSGSCDGLSRVKVKIKVEGWGKGYGSGWVWR